LEFFGQLLIDRHLRRADVDICNRFSERSVLPNELHLGKDAIVIKDERNGSRNVRATGRKSE